MTKAAETKPAAATAAKNNQPFFNKGGGSSMSFVEETIPSFFTGSPGIIQSKLSVGHPDDKYEQEADRVADQVVRLPTKPINIQAKCAACEEEELQKREEEQTEEVLPEIQKNTITEAAPEPPASDSTDNTPPLSSNFSPAPVQLKCATCEEEEIQEKEKQGEEETIQTKLTIGASGDPYEKEADAVADKVVQRLQLKPALNQPAENIQRSSCRECDEGEYVFRKPVISSFLQLDGEPALRADGSRDSIIAAAKTMLGRIEARNNDGAGKRVGANSLLEIFHLAAPGVWDDSIIETAGTAMPSWCGIFSVWAHKKAGKDIGSWQMGRGVSAFGTLTQTVTPQPGDIGYIDQPYQHHCIVVKVDGDSVHSIDGNSGNHSEVIESRRPLSAYSGFFTAFGPGSSVQRKVESNSTASPSIESRLSTSKGSGSALPDDTRRNMESSIGADFSEVKIHTDSSAVQMSKDLHAQAFTNGSDIYFNSGKFDTSNAKGQHLLAHELTHTVQQGAASEKPDLQRQEGTSFTQSATQAYNITTLVGNRFIVDDSDIPTTNQLIKSSFLDRLNMELCQVTNEALAGSPFSADTCPYIARALARFRTQEPVQIEQTLLRYEPRLRNAANLAHFFEIIRNRIRTAVAAWLQTGDLTDIPAEIIGQLPEQIRLTARIVGTMQSAVNAIRAGGDVVRSGVNAVLSGVSNTISGMGSLFFKSKNGGAKNSQSPDEVLQQLGEGATIQPDVQHKMEDAFGASFSDVKIHADSNAGQLAGSMNARAFAVGKHIAFAQNEYKPGTLYGDALMAHELAHTRQQQSASSGSIAEKNQKAQEDSLEKNADSQAVHAMSNIWNRKTGQKISIPETNITAAKTGLKLQRCGGPVIPEWNGDVRSLRINLFTTTNLNETPVDPGEAITRDFPSFVARMNYYPRPPVMAYRLLNQTGSDVVGPRIPASSGVSRIPMPPLGQYTLVGDVRTGIPEIPMFQVTRPIHIIESYRTLADRQAPGDLAAQGGRTLQGELLNFEQFAAIIRQNAVTVAGISPELVLAWNTAHAQAIVIEGAINQTVSPAVSIEGKTALRGFYGQMRQAVQASDVYHPREVNSEHDGLARITTVTPAYTSNPYLSPDANERNITQLNGSDTTTDWRRYLDTFYQVTTVLNRYIADRLEAAGFADSARQLRVSGAYNNHLRQLLRDHPDAKPVRAVFYPKLQPDLRNDAAAGETAHFQLTALPQKMYTYRTDDGKWHLLDITRHERPFLTEEEGGSRSLPPRSLMTELDSAERFPEGTMHWEFEGGTADSCEMTHPWTWSEVLNLISAVLAIAGLMALVAATGGAAAPAVPTVLFVLAGLAGAAGSYAHLRESEELGTMTQQSYTADVIGIAANLLSAGAAGAGHIVKAAQASEAAWTGWRGLSALGAQAVYRPLTFGALGSDFASLVAFSSQAVQQYNAIIRMPEGETRTTAMQRLVAMSLLTGGMTLISIRGGLHDVSSGRTLYLDFTTINGVRSPVAYRVMPQAEIVAHPRLGTTAADAEAILARTDLDSNIANQFRGELSIALNTAGMSETEIRSFVQRMSRAANATEMRAILTEFRNSRISISIGGVSRSAGYDLTYLHTSPADFHASVRQAFSEPGTLAHNGTLVHAEGGELSAYRLSLDSNNSTRIEADVVIVYSDFTTGSAIGAGTVAPGAATGPARNTPVWNPTTSRWTVRVEVDQRLSPADIRRAVGHELDEAGDVINRLNGNQGADVNAQIAALQRPGMFTGAITSHDLASLREINQLLSSAATNPGAGSSLSVLLRDLGVTTDRAQFQARLTRVLSSGHISDGRLVMLEAWATYDMALARGNSRIRTMTREQFISEYQNGRRFDEGGNYRWYNLETERTTYRQFFSDAEMGDPNLAFQRLTGPGSTSSFRPYYEMLTANHIATESQVRTRFNALLAGARGRDLDYVRHQLKDAFRNDLMGYITNRSRLRTAHPGKSFEEASHAELMRLTTGLNSSDKGSLAEEWYLAVFAPGAIPHVQFTGASGTIRYPDLIRPDGTLQDLKYIEGRLSARELEQFDEYRQMIGQNVEVPGPNGSINTLRVDRMRYSFLNPSGVEANAAWMHSILNDTSTNITFEIFNSRGQRRIINRGGVFEVGSDMASTRVADLGFLSDPTALKQWLN